MSKHTAQTVGRFCGHAGLARMDAPTSSEWFPIPAQTANKIEEVTGTYCPSDRWIALVTLSNRMVLADPGQMMISLLDDADEWPEGDPGQGGPLDDYAGISLEIYRIMAAWAERSAEFEYLGSPADRAEALSLIESSDFLDRPEALDAYLRHTRVHFSSGQIIECQLDHGCLLELLDIEGDADVQFVSIRQMDGVDRRLPLRKLVMIDLPLIEIEAARSAVLEECE